MMRISSVLSVLAAWLLSSACLTGVWSLSHENAVSRSPMVVVSVHATPAGDLVVALDDVETAFRPRPGGLVLRASELEAAFDGAPVQSRYRLPLPHVELAHERLLEGAPAGSAGLAPVPALPWDPHRPRTADGLPSPNAPPAPSVAPLALHWTRHYRTGREKAGCAFLVSRQDASGTRAAVFVVESHEGQGWDLAVRIVLLCADAALIALLLA